MATQTLPLARRAYRRIDLPRPSLRIPRPDLWIGFLAFFAGLAIPGLMAAGLLQVGLFPGLLGFLLTLGGGIYLLSCCGEIA